MRSSRRDFKCLITNDCKIILVPTVFGTVGHHSVGDPAVVSADTLDWKDCDYGDSE